MEDILDLIATGDTDAAASKLRERVASRQDAPGGHLDEARLAERLGLSTVALRAWQLALRDDPGCAEAWSALAILHEERGEGERAARCIAQLGQLGVRTESPPPPTDDAPPPGPSDADLVRFVHLFAGREDVYARMWRDNKGGVGYSPVQGPLTPELARAHAEGRLTLGVYPIRHDDTVGWFALDLDIARAALDGAAGDRSRLDALRQTVAEEGLRLRDALVDLGLSPLYEDSGQKGRHLWCFLPAPRPAAAIHAFGQALLAALAPASPDLHLEFFPKQPKLAPGSVGNLIKLPLGLHLGSGRWSALLDEAGEPLPEPFAALREVRRVDLDSLGPLPAAPPRVPAPPAPPVKATTERPWSEADFDAQPQLRVILGGCAVLREIVRGATAELSLSRDAAVVLEHTLGHLPAGVKACNYLFERVPGFPAAARLGAPHRGQPVSCARVRSRLPELVARVPCDCAFDERPGQYRHPLRHLDGGVEPARPSLDELLIAYSRAMDRFRTVEAELASLRRAALQGLRALPGGRWSAPGGEWRIDGEGELAALLWVAAESEG